MKILMLVNWKVRPCAEPPSDLQPPDYFVSGGDYWFFRYFREKPQVDVLDISTFPALERFEHDITRFYMPQGIRAAIRLARGEYDLVLSHGAQSAVVLSLLRRIHKGRAKHVLFDIGSFASASESGMVLRLLKFASRSLDGLICHASGQLSYYGEQFPWISDFARFIPFGTDFDFFNATAGDVAGSYICCVGASKRDWATLVEAYRASCIDAPLKLVGCTDAAFGGNGVELIPHVPVRRMIDIIRGATLCALPLKEYRYSYGQMTLLQQMVLGKCVVAADVTGIRDYMRAGETALVYEPGDVNGLSELISAAYKDDGFRRRIGAAGRESVLTYYNERRMATDIEDYLNWVLQGKEGDLNS